MLFLYLQQMRKLRQQRHVLAQQYGKPQPDLYYSYYAVTGKTQYLPLFLALRPVRFALIGLSDRKERKRPIERPSCIDSTVRTSARGYVGNEESKYATFKMMLYVAVRLISSEPRD
jgi:hypothetical protein